MTLMKNSRNGPERLGRSPKTLLQNVNQSLDREAVTVSLQELSPEDTYLGKGRRVCGTQCF